MRHETSAGKTLPKPVLFLHVIFSLWNGSGAPTAFSLAIGITAWIPNQIYGNTSSCLDRAISGVSRMPAFPHLTVLIPLINYGQNWSDTAILAWKSHFWSFISCLFIFGTGKMNQSTEDMKWGGGEGQDNSSVFFFLCFLRVYCQTTYLLVLFSFPL